MNGGTIFTGVLVLIGLVILLIAGRAWLQARQAASWPVAQGEITASSVSMNGSPNQNPTFNVDVQYKYVVGGVTYEGSRLAFGYVANNDHRFHSDIQQRLPPGTKLGVRYAPNDPASAVLSVGLNPLIKIGLVFGGVWTAFTLALMYMVTALGRTAAVSNSIVETLLL